MNEHIFLKDKIAYSNTKKTFNIPKDFSKINLPDKTKNIKDILEGISLEISKIKNNTIKVSGEIKNFEKVKNKISKEKLETPQDDDYEFIECTTQIEILNQVIEKSKKLNTNNENHIKTINSSLKPLEIEYNQKQEEIEEEIQTNEKVLEKHLKEIEKFKEKELNALLKQEKETSKLIDKFNKEKKELEKKFENISIQTKNQNEELKINSKISKIEFKVDSIKLDINIIKAKITTLKNHIKLKRNKQIRPIPFLLTLGLIYWTKFSDTKYIKNSLELKIHEKEEKISHLNKELFILKTNLEEITKTNLLTLKEINKEEEKIQTKISNLEEEVKNNKTKIKEITKLIEKQEKILGSYNKETHKIKELSNKLKSKLETLEENSPKSIINLLEDEIELGKEEVEKMNELKKTIENQKVEIDGEYILKL